jgi:hypothetical protein
VFFEGSHLHETARAWLLDGALSDGWELFPYQWGPGVSQGPLHTTKLINKWQHGDEDARGSFIIPCQSGSLETWRADEYCSNPCSPDSAWLRYLAQWAGETRPTRLCLALWAQGRISRKSPHQGRKRIRARPDQRGPREPGAGAALTLAGASGLWRPCGL